MAHGLRTQTSVSSVPEAPPLLRAGKDAVVALDHRNTPSSGAGARDISLSREAPPPPRAVTSIELQPGGSGAFAMIGIILALD